MGKKAPKAPDMSEYAAASERAAELGYQTSREQLDWAKEMWGEQKGLLEQVLGPQLDIMKAQYENGMKDRARYERLYQPLEENLVAEFQQYDSPERRAQRVGMAQAQVRSSQEAARNNALARLEGYGIDPSQTRSAALDRNIRAQEAAQVAAAGNQERTNVENTGRALRAEAINIGRGYPSQVAGSYGQTLQAGNSAVGNMNSTVGAGAGTMGTGLQWGNYGLAGTGQAANIRNSGFQNEMARFSAQGSPWEMLAGIGGAWAGSGFAMGGERGGAIPASLEGEYERVDDGGDLGPAGVTDTVPARLASGEAIKLAPGEFIIPREAVEFYGTDKLRKMVAKAREAQGIPVAGGAGPKVEHPRMSREVAQRPKPKAAHPGMAMGGGVPYDIPGYESEVHSDPYAIPEEDPQQGRQGGVSPATAMSMYSQFGGGGAAGGGSAAASGGGSALASAGPWAALAAAIIGNETYQNHSGNRPNDFSEQFGDMLTGKSFERDMRRAAGDSHNPSAGGKALRYAGRMGNPKGAWNATTDSLRYVQDLFD